MIGGNSLTATQLVLAVNDLFHVELNLEAVFNGVTHDQDHGREDRRAGGLGQERERQPGFAIAHDRRAHAALTRPRRSRAASPPQIGGGGCEEVSNSFILDRSDRPPPACEPERRSVPSSPIRVGFAARRYPLQKSAGNGFASRFWGFAHLRFLEERQRDDLAVPCHRSHSREAVDGGVASTGELCDYINAAMPGK